MSAVTVDGELVHYEVLGRGRPVVLVHGWIGSWRYWIPLMQQTHLKYRVYALDLFGFGDSSKNPAHYSVQHQVNMLEEFMNKMGIPKAAMIGHALGALVLTQFAKNNADRVARMMVTSMPLFDPGDLETRRPPGHMVRLTPLDPHRTPPPDLSSIPSIIENSAPPAVPAAPEPSEAETKAEAETPPPSSTAETQTAAAVSPSDETKAESETPAAEISAENPSQPAAVQPVPTPPAEQPPPAAAGGATRPENGRETSSNPLLELLDGTTLETLLGRCFKRSEPSYEKLRVDVDKTDEKVLRETAAGYNAGAVLDDLRSLQMPVVAVHGENDPFVPPPGEEIWNYLTLSKDELMVAVPLAGVRHFPMLEHEPFMRLVNDFLEIPEISKLEIKERWRRRSR